MAEEDVYKELAGRFGYGQSKLLAALLSRLATPRQARIALALPAATEELARQVGTDVESVSSDLESLYRRGLVLPKDFKNRSGYRLMPNIMLLIWNIQCLKSLEQALGPDFFELCRRFCDQEWFPDVVKAAQRSPQPQWRTLPGVGAVKDSPELQPYEDARELLRRAQLIALVPCGCRHRAGRRCRKQAYEVCLQLNRSAEYVIDRGAGRRLSYEEALAVLEQAEEAGVVHSWINSKTMTYDVMCSCCACCCQGWVPFLERGVDIEKGRAKSRYQACVDLELCDGCGLCLERCQFGALQMRALGTSQEQATVEPQKCFGCGLCVIKCPRGALRLEVVRPPQHIPDVLAVVG